MPSFLLANNFHISFVLKRFKINMNLNSIIPNNGINGINSCKNNRALVGAPHTWLIDWLIYLSCTIDLIYSLICASLYLFIIHWSCFMIAHLSLGVQLRTHSHFDYSLCMFWYSYVHDRSEYSSIFSLIVMLASFY